MNPLVRSIPAAAVRFFARPYIAGDSLTAAIDVAAENLENFGLLSTLDLLAEGIHSPASARDQVDTHLDIVDKVVLDPRFLDPEFRPSLSLKLSSFTAAPLDSGGDGSGAMEGIYEIAQRAASVGLALTIDMESHHWTDFTLETLCRLHADGFTNVGAVIQTRLHRSESDLLRLPKKCRVRLVIGAYPEEPDLAITHKLEMKKRLIEFAETLLQREHMVEFATHDQKCIQRFIQHVVPTVGATPTQFEIQMLYGVPRRALQQKLRDQELRVRLYVPFATNRNMAVAYLRRRLDERPSMMWSVAKNMFRRI